MFFNSFQRHRQTAKYLISRTCHGIFIKYTEIMAKKMNCKSIQNCDSIVTQSNSLEN